ncbi:hypothetical protein PhCBS80983_g02278 [Powellomyces hirtus]|uniref:Uncharacterized protein n=1 Tax=Powellomyces hirtus TaxID=109895 RepID=A0A507E7D9_9FUNG|nr:hypothetical protein PhCBS80983_g02278 [Powellomyces hirtus]
MSRQGPIDDGPAAPAGPVKLYVGQIAPNGSIRDLEDLFAKFGRILHVEIKPAGFGFVEFDDPRDAEDAVRALHDHPFEGKRLVVEFSKRSSTNNSTCFICGQTGHWVRECPENQDKGMDVRSGRCFKCGPTGAERAVTATVPLPVTDPDPALHAADRHLLAEITVIVVVTVALPLLTAEPATMMVPEGITAEEAAMPATPVTTTAVDLRLPGQRDWIWIWDMSACAETRIGTGTEDRDLDLGHGTRRAFALELGLGLGLGLILISDAESLSDEQILVYLL